VHQGTLRGRKWSSGKRAKIHPKLEKRVYPGTGMGGHGCQHDRQGGQRSSSGGLTGKKKGDTGGKETQYGGELTAIKGACIENKALRLEQSGPWKRVRK